MSYQPATYFCPAVMIFRVDQRGWISHFNFVFFRIWVVSMEGFLRVSHAPVVTCPLSLSFVFELNLSNLNLI